MAKAPERPSQPAAAPEPRSLAPLYFGWTRLTMGARQGAPSFGLDLDGVCTNASTCPQQRDMVPCRSHSMQIPFDGSDCIDNSFSNLVSLAGLIPLLGTEFGWSEENFNCGLARGSFNMLMRLSNYNGQRDDSHVRVDWYTSSGTLALPDWNCKDSSAERAQHWDARSAWQVDQAELLGSVSQPGELPDSRMSDTEAFVVDGKLVSHFPAGAALRLAGDGKPYRGFHLPLHGGMWTGTLHEGDDEQWRIEDGLVVGRARSDDVRQGFRQQGFCLNSRFDTFYDYVSMVIDENADVLLAGETNPEASCDAMSVGIGFRAQQVAPGAISTLEPLIECCPPGSSAADCMAECGDGKVSGKERCDTAIKSGAGACPTACAAASGCQRHMLMGSGCDAHCTPVNLTDVVGGDGCCPEGADPTRDSDCAAAARCGNSILERGESCDPSTGCGACTSTNPCLRAEPSGSRDTCDLQCKLTMVTECSTGDGCCPIGCSPTRDRDCSARCQNGTLDVESHETCEQGSSAPCAATCDDGDPCTRDIRTGDPSTCNVQCGHELIATPVDGDGCCRYQAHANANTDSDCKPVCGNGVSESGEECDDGNKQSADGCSSSCRKEDSQAICLSQFGMTGTCAECICEKCATEVRECYARGNQAERDACRSTTECVLKEKCQGLNCYCGSSATSSACPYPNGPCRSEIVDASGGAILPTTIAQRATDTNYVLGRVLVLSECGWDNCSKQCGF